MKAAIFDMDGTMVDNMNVHHKAWQKKLSQYGMDLTFDEVKEKVHGINEEILERLFGDKYTPEQRKQISWEKEEAYREIFLDQLALIDGLPDFMDQLDRKGIIMSVASAAPPENVDFVLDNLALRDRFQTILHSRDVKNGKPHPEIYLKTCELLGIAPTDGVVFEDSPTGAKSAEAAGCRIVIVTTTHERDEFDGISGILTFIKDFEKLDLEIFN
ncbi:MAG: HAD family phosphatase [Cyclobacteriaceae bacterium]